MKDIKEIVYRMDTYGMGNYDLESITKSGEIWNLTVKVGEDSSTACYDLCRALNGYDKNDYFSVLHFNKKTDGKYFLQVKRITNETESN